MKKTVILLTIILCISCLRSTKNKEDKTNSKYMKEYSGGYMVEVDGQSSAEKVEVYALNENGGASWLWVENNSKEGAIIEDKKVGTWQAWNDTISIDIQGNSGNINETFILVDGTFREKRLTKRWLKRTEN